MRADSQKTIEDGRVSAVKIEAPGYPAGDGENEIRRAVRQNAQNLGWSESGRGAFGKVIAKGAKVLVKPNFVLHKNQGRAGLLPLVTHPSLIKAVVAEALEADPGEILVADAPIQSCRFDELLRRIELDRWSAELQKNEPRFKGVVDLRRTVATFVDGVRIAEEDKRSEENYVRFNLRGESLLEAITDDKKSFRVTNYDPRLMAGTHSPQNHQYLVAREIIEADVVINLPKLKTHKKAGITNALKNLVGINGNKEFLPHHRIGGADDGGDCYPGSDLLKRTLETVLDRQNMASSPPREKLLAAIGTQLERLIRLKGDKIGVEGSWLGNQTVARMTLDLNRILLYGKTDASLGETVQRRVLHLSDAVVAGQGDGPLASDELALGLILAAENAAALDWVGAYLLGYEAGKIPLLRLAFSDFRWPVAGFDPSRIELLGDWDAGVTAENLSRLASGRAVVHPFGWLDARAD
jgi:uncharacterized protein (DUF362 family)